MESVTNTSSLGKHVYYVVIATPVLPDSMRDGYEMGRWRYLQTDCANLIIYPSSLRP